MSQDDTTGQIRQKLVDTKEKLAKAGHLLTGGGGKDRLPPGQREVKNWPVLDLGIQPEIPLESWELTVDGLVENPVTWNWAQFQAQPQQQFLTDIHCVTAWSRYDNHWDGVSARHLLSVVKPKPDARHIVFHSHDGYTTNVKLEVFNDEDVLLAHSWEGKPITTEHGGPVRVIIPKYYFWKSAKWVKRIEFVAEDQPGFWEERGYHNEGDPWTEQRYS
ncbi:sulfite oxidase-like oxidoreductase [Indioceanicola profundi]|uniref:sulfite oxidase-like oxidoreductase n=1 Tax=Indioceanicola profundi TaxID=2220096 RepID=UPI000E6AC57C|nr:sulfite oxidase-like oxidoreductase [Indioceanicola profundi]